jgi:UTP--glucose-1-phosphate uridylyltransferase
VDTPIRSAVIPVAGLGTRLLPCTKSQPKEMLPVGRKPVVQYVVEEFERAGLSRILFVTGRGKHAIEDHFDRDEELHAMLAADPRKHDLLDALAFENTGLQFFYIRQSVQRGLGDAILHAQRFVEDEPFVVGLGDSIVRGPGENDLVNQLMECHRRRRASCVIAFEEVPRDEVRHYGIARPAEDGDVFRIDDLIEKPSPEEAPSCLAIAARYVLAPEIFAALERTPPGKNNEIQLTDAIRLLIQDGAPVYGVRMAQGVRRYDVGNFESYMRTFIEFALEDDVLGTEMRAFVRGLLAGRRD